MNYNKAIEYIKDNLEKKYEVKFTKYGNSYCLVSNKSKMHLFSEFIETTQDGNSLIYQLKVPEEFIVFDKTSFNKKHKYTNKDS